jgi:hypothetical protein
VGVLLNDAAPEVAPERVDLTDRMPSDASRPGDRPTFLISDRKDLVVRVPEGATRLFLGSANGYTQKLSLYLRGGGGDRGPSPRLRSALLSALREDKPKSDAGDREVALDAGTVAALRAHRRRQIASRLQWGPAWVDSGKVFTREDGSVLHPATVTNRFQTLAAAATLPPIRLHDLRRGAASLMLAAGVAPKVVQETLGHSSITLTLDTYTSVYDEVAAEAAEAAAALVPRAGTSAHTPHTHPTSGATRGPGKPWSDGGAGGARTHDLTDYEKNTSPPQSASTSNNSRTPNTIRRL